MAGLPTGIDRSGRRVNADSSRRDQTAIAQEHVMFCRKCGAVNPADSTFCQSCGTRFSMTGIIPPKSTQYDEEQHLTSVLVGRYEVIRMLGAGGMANVYIAREEALDRYVAVKVLPQAYIRNEDFVERFKREAKISAQLEHPNIITIHAIGVESDIIYFVMNYLSGGSLADRIKEKNGLDVLEVIRWGRDISKALAYAHERGVIHRDLKPENVMLDDEENAVVTDFGIAFAAEGTRMTKTGVAVGTAAYMSPEQAAGKQIDCRSDIYALGVLLYQMSTGTLPFQATNPASLMYQHVHEPPEPPDVRNAKVPPWLRDTILTCLAKKPDDRYGNAAEVLASLTEGYRLFKNGLKQKTIAKPSAKESNPTSELRNLQAREAETGQEISAKGIVPPQADQPVSVQSEQSMQHHSTPTPVVNPVPFNSPDTKTIPPQSKVPVVQRRNIFEVATKMLASLNRPLRLPKWLPAAGLALLGALIVTLAVVYVFGITASLRHWDWVAEPRYEWAQSFDAQGLARVMENEQYGFINRAGALVIEPQYTDVWPFEGDFTAVKEGDWWGFINKAGDVLTTAQFDNARGYQDGLVPVQIGSLWGYVNALGTLSIKPQFEDVGMFNEGVAPVYRNGRWGVINRSGVLVAPSRYEDAGPASEGLLAVRQNNKWGYIDTYGDMVIAPQFDWAGQFSDNHALVSMDGEWGYVNSSGEMVVEPFFDDGLAFKEGFALVKKDGLSSYIDTAGVLLTDKWFEDADSFSEGYALVYRGNAWGYLDTTGELAIQPAFEDARDFSEGVAAVQSNGLWGYIDTSGEYVIKSKFNNAYSFAQGIAAVQTSDGWGYIQFAE